MFDVLYNNTASNQAPKLDDYEKSLYLTKAQDEIVKNHFTAVSNSIKQGFDDSFKRQAEFAPLIKVATLDPVTASGLNKIDQRSILYLFPEDYFLSINEELYEQKGIETEYAEGGMAGLPPAPSNPVSVIKTYQYMVNPVQYGEYKRQMLKPYQYPVKRTAWRLFNGSRDNRIIAEVIGRFHTNKPVYQLRYVKHPEPIILADLTTGEFENSGLTIGGKTAKSMCELGTDAFNEVMQRAVELAKNAWEGNIETTKALGERSE